MWGKSRATSACIKHALVNSLVKAHYVLQLCTKERQHVQWRPTDLSTTLSPVSSKTKQSSRWPQLLSFVSQFCYQSILLQHTYFDLRWSWYANYFVIVLIVKLVEATGKFLVHEASIVIMCSITSGIKINSIIDQLSIRFSSTVTYRWDMSTYNLLNISLCNTYFSQPNC